MRIIGFIEKNTLCNSYPHFMKALGTGHFSPKELYEGNLEGRLPYWGPEIYAK
jgi:hypothetical protein